MSRLWKALAITVAVVLAAAIITPNLIHSHLPDGVSPVGVLRMLNTAEITYAATYPNIGFSPSLAMLGGTTSGTPNEQQAGLISNDLASGKFIGYRFTLAVTRDEKSGINVRYETHANPDPNVKPRLRASAPRNMWERIFPPKPVPELRLYFYSDQSGVIRYERDHEANANSPAL